MSALWPTGSAVQPNIIRWYGRQFDPFTKVESLHAGVDIAASAGLFEGTPLHAAEAGTVIHSGISGSLKSGYGNLIVIRTPGNDYYLYGHLQTGTLHPLGPIGQGDIVGHCGHTGGATGPHSHFGAGHGGWDYAHLSDPTVFMLAKNGPTTAGVSGTPITIQEDDDMKIITDSATGGGVYLCDTGHDLVHIENPADLAILQRVVTPTDGRFSMAELQRIKYYMLRFAPVSDTELLRATVTAALAGLKVTADTTTIAKAVDAALADNFAALPGRINADAAARLAK